jgi:hypothetical protein
VQAMHRVEAAAETALQRYNSAEFLNGVTDEWNAFGCALSSLYSRAFTA